MRPAAAEDDRLVKQAEKVRLESELENLHQRVTVLEHEVERLRTKAGPA